MESTNSQKSLIGYPQLARAKSADASLKPAFLPGKCCPCATSTDSETSLVRRQSSVGLIEEQAIKEQCFNGLGGAVTSGRQWFSWAMQRQSPQTPSTCSSASSSPHPHGGRRQRDSWSNCIDDGGTSPGQDVTSPASSLISAVSVLTGGYGQMTPQASRRTRREELMRELFWLHDLNGNGVLEEDELVKLNEKIAMLHYGKDTDRQVVKDKYCELFRTKLDGNGDPAASQAAFETHILQVLEAHDPGDMMGQESILQSWIDEAHIGRLAFHQESFASVSDAPWMPILRDDEQALFGAESTESTRTRSQADRFGPHLPHAPVRAMPSLIEEEIEDQVPETHSVSMTYGYNSLEAVPECALDSARVSLDSARGSSISRSISLH